MEDLANNRVAAVVVHYGDPDRTVRVVLCHEQLRVFTHIVVVANDLSRRPDGLRYSQCKWVVPDRNIGFGGACQLGARVCSADVYAFFNVHMSIDRVSVGMCVSAFDIQDVGIVAPCVYRPQSGDPTLDWRRARCRRTYSRILQLPVHVPSKKHQSGADARGPMLVDNEWATGAAIFCRKEVVTDVGWDGSYFLGYEDVDISLRAKKLGWRVVSVPSAIAYHTGQSTRQFTEASYYHMRNTVWFARRYRTRRVQSLVTGFLVLLVLRIAAADALKRRKPLHVGHARRGVVDGWLLWPDTREALPEEPLGRREVSARVRRRREPAEVDRHV